MGGLWVDFDKSVDGRLVVGSPRNQATNIGGLYAAGEVDYAYTAPNRLGATPPLVHLRRHGRGPRPPRRT